MRKASLPKSSAAPETYEGRFHSRVQHELDDLHSAIDRLQQGRLHDRLALPAAPTTGKYALGDIVRNDTPVEAGGAGSKYVIVGWICTALSPLTFNAMRTLTGN